MTRPPRRYWRDHRGQAVWLVCLLLVSWRLLAVNRVQAGPELLEEGEHEVSRVAEDCTLLLPSGARVQLQGIDIPDSVLVDATRFTADFIDHADRRVRLTFGLERKDHHDRFLAFIWHDGAMLNEELLRAGLAHARLEYRHSGLMTRRLATAQDEARRAGRGIWIEKGTILDADR